VNSSQLSRKHIVRFLCAGGSRRTFFYQHIKASICSRPMRGPVPVGQSPADQRTVLSQAWISAICCSVNTSLKGGI
jgi:hypothetical protein